MKHSKFLVIILFLSFSVAGYGQQNLQRQLDSVFTKYMDSIRSDPSTTSLRKALKDSVQSWIDKKLKYATYIGKTVWKIEDAVFYNQKRDKAILFILFQSHEKNARFDYSKAIGAEKIKGSWKFYYASYVLMAWDRKNKPVPLEELSANARSRMITDGFIWCHEKYRCRVNYHYIESDFWFTDWMRKKHILFLNNQLPDPSFEKAEDHPH